MSKVQIANFMYALFEEEAVPFILGFLTTMELFDFILLLETHRDDKGRRQETQQQMER